MGLVIKRFLDITLYGYHVKIVYFSRDLSDGVVGNSLLFGPGGPGSIPGALIYFVSLKRGLGSILASVPIIF